MNRRRFPWLTTEDMQVLAGLEPEAAREFENALRRDSYARDHDLLPLALDELPTDLAIAGRPCGRGRRRPTYSAGE